MFQVDHFRPTANFCPPVLTLLRGGVSEHPITGGGGCNFASPWISQQLQMLEHGNLVRICTKIICIGISC